MLCQLIIAVTVLVGSALAGFDIRTGQTEWWASDEAEVYHLCTIDYTTRQMLTGLVVINRQRNVESH